MNHPAAGRSDGVVMLTLFRTADASLMAEADGDPEIRRWFEFPPEFVPSIEHSKTVVSRWRAERTAGRLPYAVRDAASGELLGGCELRPERSGTGGVSYWTYPAHRGKGVAARALRILCEIAFCEMGLRRLELLADPANTASRRVAASGAFTPAGKREDRLLFVRNRAGQPGSL